MHLHPPRSPQPSPVHSLIKRPRPGRRCLRYGHMSGTRKHENLANPRALPTSTRSLGLQMATTTHYGWPALKINTPTQCHNTSSTALRLAVNPDYAKRFHPEILCPKPCSPVRAVSQNAHSTTSYTIATGSTPITTTPTSSLSWRRSTMPPRQIKDGIQEVH